MHCQERDRLSKSATDALSQIISITQKMLDANKANNLRAIQQLDKELEQLVGLKERSFGALHQHQKEHGC
jgi:hypothetical protein